MMRRHYRSRRPRSSRIFRNLFSSFFLIVLGSAGFYGALEWFRGDAPTTSAMTPAAAEASNPTVTQVAVPAPTTVVSTSPVVATTVPLVSRYDGQRTGKVDRYPLGQGFEFYVLGYLPALDTNLETYHVWLLKDGLADVRDMGELTVRADGSWVGHEVADTMSGFTEAATYRSLVIMRQTHDATSAPTGTRIAEANFE